MNLREFNGASAPWALLAANLCKEAYGTTDFLSVRAAMQVFGEGPVEITGRRLEGGVPAALLCLGPDDLMLAVSGVTDLFQGAAIKAAYEELVVTNDTLGFNRWFYNSAGQLMRNLNLERRARGRSIYLFGHSGGGGICLALAAIIRAFVDPREIHVCTFGSPRASTQGGTEATAGIDITRWMNHNDEVPILPPRLADISDQLFLLQIANVPLWQRFVHHPGGIVFSNFAGPVAALEPTGLRLIGYANWPLSYLRTGAVFGTPHSIQEYIRRIDSLLPSSVALGPVEPKGPVGLPTIPKLFQVYGGDNALSLPIPYEAGVERATPPADVVTAVIKRQAFISEPLKRC